MSCRMMSLTYNCLNNDICLDIKLPVLVASLSTQCTLHGNHGMQSLVVLPFQQLAAPLL